MRRREFIALLGGAAVATWPLVAQSEQAGRNRTVGVLHPGQAAAACRSYRPNWFVGGSP